MAPIKIYGMIASGPVRGVLLAAAALDLPYEIVEVNPMTGETRTPEFLKMNPMHTIPTVDDNGFYIWESHAIVTYLAAQYAPGSDLYPTDPKKRAVVDQRLHFDNGTLNPKLGGLLGPVFGGGAKEFPKEALAAVNDGYDFLETFLEKGPWLTGDTMTLADTSCLATVSGLVELVPLSEQKYPKLSAWLERCRALPYYQEANQKGVDMLIGYVKSKLNA